MDNDIIFGQSASELILDELGMQVDDDGYIIWKEDGKRVESAEGEEVRIEEFGGVGKGSKIVVKDDFSSVSEFVEEKYNLLE